MHCAPSHRVHERSTFPFSSAKSLSLRGSFIHIPNLVCTMRRYTLRCIMCVWVSECVDHSRAYKLNWNWIVVEELKRYETHAMSIEPKKEKKMDYYKENGTVIRREMWKSYARCVAVEWTARSSKSIDLYSLCFVIVTISFSRTHTHTHAIRCLIYNSYFVSQQHRQHKQRISIRRWRARALSSPSFSGGNDPSDDGVQFSSCLLFFHAYCESKRTLTQTTTCLSILNSDLIDHGKNPFYTFYGIQTVKSNANTEQQTQWKIHKSKFLWMFFLSCFRLCVRIFDTHTQNIVINKFKCGEEKKNTIFFSWLWKK